MNLAQSFFLQFYVWIELISFKLGKQNKRNKIHQKKKKRRADACKRKQVDMAQQGVKRETDLIESVKGILCSQESWFRFGQILLTIPLFSTHHHSNGRHFTFLTISYRFLFGHFLCFYSNNLRTANNINLAVFYSLRI